MKYIKFLFRLIIISILACFIFAPVVHAITLEPSSTPSLTDIYIFRHLLQDNDFLAIAKYNLPYSVIPSSTVDQAFVFRFIHTDNVTELAVNEAYAYKDKGYGYGLISFYFDNVTAPAWGLSYNIQIAGKPSEIPSMPYWTFSVPSGAYSTATDQEGNQADLYDKVIDIAQDLEGVWTKTLLESTDTGIVLDSNGEIYFRRAIPGLQFMAPELFLIQIEDPDYSERGWGTTQATTYEGRYSGTWFGNAISAISDLLSIDFHLVASIPILIIAILVIVVGASQNNVYSGFISAIMVILYGCIQGWTPMAIMGMGTVLSAVYLGYHWFLKGAQ